MKVAQVPHTAAASSPLKINDRLDRCSSCMDFPTHPRALKVDNTEIQVLM